MFFFLYRWAFVPAAHVCKQVNSLLQVEGWMSPVWAEVSWMLPLHCTRKTLTREPHSQGKDPPGPKSQQPGKQRETAGPKVRARVWRETKPVLEAEPHRLIGILIILVVSCHRRGPVSPTSLQALCGHIFWFSCLIFLIPLWLRTDTLTLGEHASHTLVLASNNTWPLLRCKSMLIVSWALNLGGVTIKKRLKKKMVMCLVCLQTERVYGLPKNISYTNLLCNFIFLNFMVIMHLTTISSD